MWICTKQWKNSKCKTHDVEQERIAARLPSLLIPAVPYGWQRVRRRQHKIQDLRHLVIESLPPVRVACTNSHVALLTEMDMSSLNGGSIEWRAGRGRGGVEQGRRAREGAQGSGRRGRGGRGCRAPRSDRWLRVTECRRQLRLGKVCGVMFLTGRWLTHKCWLEVESRSRVVSRCWPKQKTIVLF